VSTEPPPIEPWVLPVAGDALGSSPHYADWLFARVRRPVDDVRAELISRGFVFRGTPRQGVPREVLNLGGRLLARAPSLEVAVERAVGEIILLRTLPAFDISHSEPRWPRTIFISVPSKPGMVSALRAVENVIHEAMHLQLTTMECADPLVADETAQMVSPWREQLRHLRGVLHGVYVFRCIAAFFALPALAKGIDEDGARHVARRRDEIANELSQVDFDRLAAGLTPRGRLLVNS
jgi:HEXXH motif-containing protein